MVTLTPLKFDINEINNKCLDSLLHIFNSISGTRHILILDKALANRLNLLSKFNVLKERGNILSVLWLEEDISINLNELNLNSFIILSTNDLYNVEFIHRRLTQLKSLGIAQVQVSCVVVDEISKGFEYQIEQEGVKGEMEFYLWKLSPSLLDQDILSLETNDVKELYIREIDEPIFKLAKSLTDLMEQFPGLIKFNSIVYKGDRSKQFYNVFSRLQTEHSSSLNPLERKHQEAVDNSNVLNYSLTRNSNGQFFDLLIFERNLDFVTPLLHQLTYLGLVDEFYDFNCNVVNFGAEKINFDFSEDEILDIIKNLNFSSVGPVLNSYAKSLQQQFDERHNVKKISQVKEFVGKLSGLQKQQFNLKTHTQIAEDILSNVKQEDDELFSQVLELEQNILENYLDYKKATDKIISLIYCGLEIIGTLRLCCLLSVTKNGVNEKNYVLLKNEIIQNFGIKHILTLQNLSTMRLFFIRELTGLLASSNDPLSDIKDFSGLSSYLNLIPVESEDVSDASFAFPSYIPVISRLVQGLFDTQYMKRNKHLSNTPTLKGLEDLAKYLKGDFEQHSSYDKQIKVNNKAEIITFVVVIGGITYGEVATLRFIEKQLKEKGILKKFIILSDNIINGKKLVESAIPKGIDD